MRPESSGTFQGFGPEATAFLADLAADNTREHFHADRPRYEEHVRLPLEDLMDLAGARYGPAKVMRPNRDVRFSKDKSPYTTTASGYAGRGAGGVYVSLSVDGLMVGGGLYDPSRDQLARARERIAEHRTAGTELEAILRALEERGMRLAGPTLKVAPKGYPRDHPRIELLRHTRYAAAGSIPAGGILTSPALWPEIDAAWRAVEPLLAWLDGHVGPAQQWP